MQRLEVSCAVRRMYTSLGAKELRFFSVRSHLRSQNIFSKISRFFDCVFQRTCDASYMDMAFPVTWIWLFQIHGYGFSSYMDMVFPVTWIWLFQIHGYGFSSYMDMAFPFTWIWLFQLHGYGFSKSVCCSATSLVVV